MKLKKKTFTIEIAFQHEGGEPYNFGVWLEDQLSDYFMYLDWNDGWLVEAELKEDDKLVGSYSNQPYTEEDENDEEDDR